MIRSSIAKKFYIFVIFGGGGGGGGGGSGTPVPTLDPRIGPDNVYTY